MMGDIGLPVPEETVLALAGYAAQRGQLHLLAVLAVGIGYGISYGFGDAIQRLSGHAQFIMLGAAGILTLALIARRVVRGGQVAH
jgi:hypothetical protein